MAGLREDVNTKMAQENIGACMAGRESAAQLLRRRAEALHQEAVGLVKLANHIEYMPHEVDEAIFNLIVRKL